MATKASVTCLSCPAFQDEAATTTALGRSIGSPTCRVKGIPLLVPADANTEKGKIKLEVIANTCDYYGNASIRAHSAPVFLGDPGAGLQIGQNQDGGQTDPNPFPDPANVIPSCRSCKSFVSAITTADRTGWTGAGTCTARGMLVPIDKASQISNKCKSALKGPAVDPVNNTVTRASLDGFVFSPIYGMKSATLGQDQVVQELIEPTQPKVDPREYVSDYPVGPAESAEGIRAWRKITNPGNKDQFVLLAIYNNDYFSPEEQAKIPQAGDDEAPDLYNDYSENLYKVAVAWNELNETPALWGEPGTGKTEFFRYVAWLMQLPFERMSITATTEVDDLIGNKEFTPEQGTYFRYGRLPLAWQKPCVIVLDEPNVGPPEVWQALRPLTDNSKQLVIEQAAEGGVRLERHADCYLGMAMNPAWDARNAGTESIADADSSRLMHLAVELPDAKTEMQIILDRVAKDGWKIGQATLDQLMTVAADIRRLSDQGTIGITWGIRHQIKVARALKWFSPAEAYRLAAGDFLEPSQRHAILDIVRTTMSRVQVSK